MMFIVVAINVFVYLLIPQYAIYGDQNFLSIANVFIDSLDKPNNWKNDHISSYF
jgi:hypothetical protein